jgi:tRNA U34 5-methylaminomethyl-2-thiouridine-forming methyltransferase MnmC
MIELKQKYKQVFLYTLIAIVSIGIAPCLYITAKMLRTLSVHTGDISENGWHITRTESGYTVGFNDAFNSSKPPSFTLLDEEGGILSSYVIDNNTSSISVSVSSEVRSKNEYLYFVVNEGDWLRVYRFGQRENS